MRRLRQPVASPPAPLAITGWLGWDSLQEDEPSSGLVATGSVPRFARLEVNFALATSPLTRVMSCHHDAAPMADESEEQELKRLFESIRADAQSRSEERSTRLAHRLIRSVLPLFVMDERDHLERIGTCVMVRVDSQLFLLTAGHVLTDAGTKQLWAISGPKGRTIGLPSGISVSHDRDTEIDVGVIPLPENAVLSFFDGCAPIEESEINEAYVVDHGSAGTQST